MKVNDILGDFGIWTTIEEEQVLQKLTFARPLNSFPEREQFTIEGLIRKSLVIKIGTEHPKVIRNEPKL